jgi:predicted nucleotidyltransferase
MRPSQALERHRDRIREIALSHRVTNVRVFGSVLSGEDTEESDLDILVDPTAETTYFDLGAIQYELSELLGLRVDVLTLESLPERFRQRVLDEARPV